MYYSDSLFLHCNYNELVSIIFSMPWPLNKRILTRFLPLFLLSHSFSLSLISFRHRSAAPCPARRDTTFVARPKGKAYLFCSKPVVLFYTLHSLSLPAVPPAHGLLLTRQSDTASSILGCVRPVLLAVLLLELLALPHTAAREITWLNLLDRSTDPRATAYYDGLLAGLGGTVVTLSSGDTLRMELPDATVDLVESITKATSSATLLTAVGPIGDADVEAILADAALIATNLVFVGPLAFDETSTAFSTSMYYTLTEPLAEALAFSHYMKNKRGAASFGVVYETGKSVKTIAALESFWGADLHKVELATGVDSTQALQQLQSSVGGNVLLFASTATDEVEAAFRTLLGSRSSGSLMVPFALQPALMDLISARGIGDAVLWSHYLPVPSQTQFQLPKDITAKLESNGATVAPKMMQVAELGYVAGKVLLSATERFASNPSTTRATFQPQLFNQVRYQLTDVLIGNYGPACTTSLTDQHLACDANIGGHFVGISTFDISEGYQELQDYSFLYTSTTPTQDNMFAVDYDYRPSNGKSSKSSSGMPLWVLILIIVAARGMLSVILIAVDSSEKLWRRVPIDMGRAVRQYREIVVKLAKKYRVTIVETRAGEYFVCASLNTCRALSLARDLQLEMTKKKNDFPAIRQVYGDGGHLSSKIPWRGLRLRVAINSGYDPDIQASKKGEIYLNPKCPVALVAGDVHELTGPGQVYLTSSTREDLTPMETSKFEMTEVGSYTLVHGDAAAQYLYRLACALEAPETPRSSDGTSSSCPVVDGGEKEIQVIGGKAHSFTEVEVGAGADADDVCRAVPDVPEELPSGKEERPVAAGNKSSTKRAAFVAREYRCRTTIRPRPLPRRPANGRHILQVYFAPLTPEQRTERLEEACGLFSLPLPPRDGLGREAYNELLIEVLLGRLHGMLPAGYIKAPPGVEQRRTTLLRRELQRHRPFRMTAFETLPCGAEEPVRGEARYRALQPLVGYETVGKPVQSPGNRKALAPLVAYETGEVDMSTSAPKPLTRASPGSDRRCIVRVHDFLVLTRVWLPHVEHRPQPGTRHSFSIMTNHYFSYHYSEWSVFIIIVLANTMRSLRLTRDEVSAGWRAARWRHRIQLVSVTREEAHLDPIYFFKPKRKKKGCDVRSRFILVPSSCLDFPECTASAVYSTGHRHSCTLSKYNNCRCLDVFVCEVLPKKRWPWLCIDVFYTDLFLRATLLASLSLTGTWNYPGYLVCCVPFTGITPISALPRCFISIGFRKKKRRKYNKGRFTSFLFRVPLCFRGQNPSAPLSVQLFIIFIYLSLNCPLCTPERMDRERDQSVSVWPPHQLDSGKRRPSVAPSPAPAQQTTHCLGGEDGEPSLHEPVIYAIAVENTPMEAFKQRRMSMVRGEPMPRSLSGRRPSAAGAITSPSGGASSTSFRILRLNEPAVQSLSHVHQSQRNSKKKNTCSAPDSATPDGGDTRSRRFSATAPGSPRRNAPGAGEDAWPLHYFSGMCTPGSYKMGNNSSASSLAFPPEDGASGDNSVTSRSRSRHHSRGRHALLSGRATRRSSRDLGQRCSQSSIGGAVSTGNNSVSSAGPTAAPMNPESPNRRFQVLNFNSSVPLEQQPAHGSPSASPVLCRPLDCHPGNAKDVGEGPFPLSGSTLHQHRAADSATFSSPTSIISGALDELPFSRTIARATDSPGATSTTIDLPSAHSIVMSNTKFGPKAGEGIQHSNFFYQKVVSANIGASSSGTSTALRATSKTFGEREKQSSEINRLRVSDGKQMQELIIYIFASASNEGLFLMLAQVLDHGDPLVCIKVNPVRCVEERNILDLYIWFFVVLFLRSLFFPSKVVVALRSRTESRSTGHEANLINNLEEHNIRDKNKQTRVPPFLSLCALKFTNKREEMKRKAHAPYLCNPLWRVDVEIGLAKVNILHARVGPRPNSKENYKVVSGETACVRQLLLPGSRMQLLGCVCRFECVSSGLGTAPPACVSESSHFIITTGRVFHSIIIPLSFFFHLIFNQSFFIVVALIQLVQCEYAKDHFQCAQQQKRKPNGLCMIEPIGEVCFRWRAAVLPTHLNNVVITVLIVLLFLSLSLVSLYIFFCLIDCVFRGIAILVLTHTDIDIYFICDPPFLIHSIYLFFSFCQIELISICNTAFVIVFVVGFGVVGLLEASDRPPLGIPSLLVIYERHGLFSFILLPRVGAYRRHMIPCASPEGSSSSPLQQRGGSISPRRRTPLEQCQPRGALASVERRVSPFDSEALRTSASRNPLISPRRSSKTHSCVLPALATIAGMPTPSPGSPSFAFASASARGHTQPATARTPQRRNSTDRRLSSSGSQLINGRRQSSQSSANKDATPSKRRSMERKISAELVAKLLHQEEALQGSDDDDGNIVMSPSMSASNGASAPLSQNTSASNLPGNIFEVSVEASHSPLAARSREAIPSPTQNSSPAMQPAPPLSEQTSPAPRRHPDTNATPSPTRARGAPVLPPSIFSPTEAAEAPFPLNPPPQELPPIQRLALQPAPRARPTSFSAPRPNPYSRRQLPSAKKAQPFILQIGGRPYRTSDSPEKGATRVSFSSAFPDIELTAGDDGAEVVQRPPPPSSSCQSILLQGGSFASRPRRNSAGSSPRSAKAPKERRRNSVTPPTENKWPFYAPLAPNAVHSPFRMVGLDCRRFFPPSYVIFSISFFDYFFPLFFYYLFILFSLRCHRSSSSSLGVGRRHVHGALSMKKQKYFSCCRILVSGYGEEENACPGTHVDRSKGTEIQSEREERPVALLLEGESTKKNGSESSEKPKFLLKASKSTNYLKKCNRTCTSLLRFFGTAVELLRILIAPTNASPHPLVTFQRVSAVTDNRYRTDKAMRLHHGRRGTGLRSSCIVAALILKKRKEAELRWGRSRPKTPDMVIPSFISLSPPLFFLSVLVHFAGGRNNTLSASILYFISTCIVLSFIYIYIYGLGGRSKRGCASIVYSVASYAATLRTTFPHSPLLFPLLKDFLRPPTAADNSPLTGLQQMFGRTCGVLPLNFIGVIVFSLCFAFHCLFLTLPDPFGMQDNSYYY
eukprot:gene3643-2578_t